MRYRVYDDPFGKKQPPFDFLRELNENVHKNVAPTKLPPAEILADFPDKKGLLETAYADFRDYLNKSGNQEGDSFRFVTEFAPTEQFEAYTVAFTPDSCTVRAADTEGIRRGLVYVEDELQRNHGDLPREGFVTRKPWLKSSLARPSGRGVKV